MMPGLITLTGYVTADSSVKKGLPADQGLDFRQRLRLQLALCLSL
jgi:hypothetical protein